MRCLCTYAFRLGISKTDLPGNRDHLTTSCVHDQYYNVHIFLCVMINYLTLNGALTLCAIKQNFH